MRIRFRLAASHGVLLVFLAAVMSVAASRLDWLTRTTRDLVEGDARRAELAHAINLHAESAAARLALLFILEDREQRVGMYQEIDAHNASIESAVAALGELVQEHGATAEFSVLREQRETFDEHFTATVEALESGERASAARLMAGPTRASLKTLLDAAAGMARRQQESMGRRQAAILEVTQDSILIVLALGVGALGVGLLMAWRITRSITQPLELAAVGAERIAMGNLADTLPTGGRDELGHLLGSMADMRSRLGEVIGAIRQHAGSVGDAAGALLGPAELVDAGSSEQRQLAVAIEHSVAGFSRGIGNLAANVEHTRDEALKARDMAERGAHAIGTAADEITRVGATIAASAKSVSVLDQSAREVAGTVGVIREIADQTNLLALNASIEAARAGDSGRGFAVVADEVRKLAARTAEATGEIDRVIAAINQRTRKAVEDIETGRRDMERGIALIRDIVGPLESLRAGAQVSLDELQRLTSVVAEQRRESEAIAGNVGAIVGMATANQSAADQVATIIRGLGGTARDLQSSVAIFRL